MNFKFLDIIPKKQISEFIIVIILLILASVIEIIGIGFIPVFVGFLIDPNIYFEKVNINFIKNFFYALNELEIIIRSCFILCIIFIFKNFFLSFLLFYEGNFTKKIKINNANKLFEKFICSPYSYHLDKNPSVFVRSVTTDVNQSTNYLKNITLILKETLVLIFIFSLLIYSDPKITTLIFLTLGFLSFIFFFLIRNNLKNRGVINLSANSSLLKVSNQSFNAIKDVKLFNKELYLTNLFTKYLSILEKNHLWSYFLTSLPRFILEIFSIIGIVGVVLFLYIEKGSIVNSLPLITLMVVSTIRLIPSFNTITKSLSSMKYNQASMLYVSSIFKNENSINSKRFVDKIQKDINGSKKITKFEKFIELKNVSFKYENNKSYILKDINIKIEKNSKIAIIGKSGSGKTTIVDILIGLLEPTEGSLLIDNEKVSELVSWKKRIGYIPQNFYLFDESIKKNVAFGINEENIDENKVIKALEFAQLKGFVDTLEKNIETKVGNQGVKLSGGQKQRIIIARAVYNNPDVLILDEATSAIDEEVEKDFINNLLKIGKNKTIIIISHRNSTIENCDRVLKVVDGKITNIDEN